MVSPAIDVMSGAGATYFTKPKEDVDALKAKVKALENAMPPTQYTTI
jgi:hypothetical protein